MDRNMEFNEDLLKLFFGSGNTNIPYVPFMCAGSSGESKPVQSFLKIVSFVRESGDYPESYVFCPRLTIFYDTNSGNKFRCVEDKDKKDAGYYSAHRGCPYFHPKSK
jgi:hypothetical protein